MSGLKKTAAVGMTSLLAVGAVVAPAMASAQGNNAPDVSAQVTAPETVNADTGVVYLSEVEGNFAFTQGEVSSNADIKKYIGDAAKYLCGNGPINDEGVAAKDWKIQVKGAVSNPETLSFEQFLASEEMQLNLTVGCSCMGNAVDGSASVNAEVCGIPLSVIMDIVKPAEEANTVVFSSDDGYSVALPLEYVQTHYGMIVYDINGAPLADSVGGTTQLWMGATSANYFARDIESITFEVREQAPVSPSSPEARAAYSNLPNVGLLYGGDIR